MTTIIGIAGRKHAGKDTAASVLVEERGYTNIKFADGIKKAARLLFEFLDYEPDAIERLVDGSTKEVPIDQFKGNYSEAIFSDFAGAHAPELADILGISVDDFDNLDLPKFTGDTSREFQQFLGTEIGRNLIGESVWTDAALTKALEHPRVVISDVRFPNEVNAIRASGGTVIRVNRITEDTGFSNHPSEIYIDTGA